ncbi:enoyl-CoA delta isomerase 1, mitochondrial-like [Pseudoliparis swirei]|uniref:enoyl-CoA delta isomerase 1, mitochondrial-like n=1 Tax=Pseudoliparis swirei TaxID=2059687 RepID=UPI0024BD8161|nr:enoyl-CoA delta isomerase 1, mitochondrial-like [Pseudoliparis swirei]
MWLKLYGSSMVTIAAINGSSPAGGCLMSMTCDYRIMADNPRHSVGLNETQLGIVAPFWARFTGKLRFFMQSAPGRHLLLNPQTSSPEQFRRISTRSLSSEQK